MAALTAEVIQLFAASISTSASVEVMLSLADPQTVAEGLLPSPPARICYPDRMEGKSLSSVWAQLEHYRDYFKCTISLQYNLHFRREIDIAIFDQKVLIVIFSVIV